MIAARGAGIPSSVLLSVPVVITAATKKRVKGIKQVTIMFFTPSENLYVIYNTIL